MLCTGGSPNTTNYVDYTTGIMFEAQESWTDTAVRPSNSIVIYGTHKGSVWNYSCHSIKALNYGTSNSKLADLIKCDGGYDSCGIILNWDPKQVTNPAFSPTLYPHFTCSITATSPK